MTEAELPPRFSRVKNHLAPCLSPVWVAFFASVILSLIAIGSHDTLNRDGMLYVDTARIFLQDGFTAALKSFPWPFLSILIALVSRTTGIGLENTGHLMNLLFMAGTCALLVSCARRAFPQAAWMTCLVVLAIPGINEYRNELVREYGCWFFVMLGLWLAQRWDAHPRWRSALAIQTSLLAATLFRPEALVFFPALMLWQFFAAPGSEKWHRLRMIGALPLLGIISLLALYLTGRLPSSRLVADIARLKLAHFSTTAQGIAATLPDYAKDQARAILFFGSLAIIPIKFISKLSLFIVPLYYALRGKQTATTEFSPLRVFAWAGGAYLVVLVVFVLGMQFLAGRYIALLPLLCTPLASLGLWQLTRRFPRGKPLMLLAAVLLMFSNVVSTNPGKSHFREAGKWLAQNATYSSRIYIESHRTAYYAGWPYAAASPRQGKGALSEVIAGQAFDLVVLEISQEDQTLPLWLDTLGLNEIRRFANNQGQAIVIAAPHPTPGSAN